MALKKLYFPHEFDASSNPTLIDVNRNFGMSGIGMYWILIENLYQSNGELTDKEIAAIAWNYHINPISEMMAVANLVLKHETDEKTNVTVYYSNGVKKRITEREERSNQARIGAKAKWGKAKKEVKLDNDGNEMTPEWYDNYFKTKKEKEARLKVTKEYREKQMKDPNSFLAKSEAVFKKYEKYKEENKNKIAEAETETVEVECVDDAGKDLFGEEDE